MTKAPISVRLLALFVDMLVLAFLVALVCMVTYTGYALSPASLSIPPLFRLALIAVCGSLSIFVFYFTYLTMNGGATVGKSMFNLRVVRLDGAHLNFFRSFARCIAYLPSLCFLLITLLVALFFRGRSIHDIIAGSQVIEEDL